MTATMILVGVAMLLFGRRLFWVFVAGIGFVSGALLAAEYLKNQNDWVLLAAALALGIFGALLAIFAQKLSIGIAGFFAGGYLAHSLAINANWNLNPWIAFVVGGVLGSILLVAIFDWALIALSSLTGSSMIAQNIPAQPSLQLVIFVVLLVIGLAVQSRQLRGRPPAPKPKEA